MILQTDQFFFNYVWFMKITREKKKLLQKITFLGLDDIKNKMEKNITGKY